MPMGKGLSSPLALGMMAGAAIGAISVSMASSRTRRKIEHGARKTMHSMSGMASDIAGKMMR